MSGGGRDRDGGRRGGGRDRDEERSRGGGRDRDAGSFADALGDVAPIRGRDHIRPPPEPSARAPRPTRRRRPRTFVVEHSGGDAFGRAEDVSRRRLADLRAGRVAPERELDLHGLDATSARRALLAALEQARRDGLRCLLVIHGVGHHSASEPVLKAQLPEWLQEPEAADAVMAFATAPRRAGGPGASLVLLRRARP